MVRSLLFIGIITILIGCQSETKDSSADTTSDPIAEASEMRNSEEVPAVQVQKKKRDYPVRYKVKDGYIKYTYKGLQEGSEEVYFTDYGMIEIKFTKTVRDNPFTSSKEEINLTTLMRDSAIYVVDNLTMNARKMDNALLYETALESPTLDLNEVAEDIFRSKGGLVVDTQHIAGVPCEKWIIKEANTTEWRWNGIMMKTLVDLPRTMVMVEAIEIDTNAEVTAEVFRLPTEVNIQDGMSMKEWMDEISKPIKRRAVFDSEGNIVN